MEAFDDQRQSKRDIPLVGASLRACKKLMEANDDNVFVFPRYCNEKTVNANSASGALNKWLGVYVPEGCVVSSFRHIMRDRLRAVQCPSGMIDQIGKWFAASVGQRYGDGFKVSQLYSYITQLILFTNGCLKHEEDIHY